MYWDVAHHRGAGFPLYLLRPFGTYPILTSLCQNPHLRPVDLRNRLTEADDADAPLVGPRDLPKGISGVLTRLRERQVIVCCVGGGRGVHTRYEITRLGAGLVGALGPLTDWAMKDFGFVVASTRARLGLPPLEGEMPAGVHQERTATRLAIRLLSGVWSNILMVHVDSAGEAGIGPLQLEDVINGRIKRNQIGKLLPHGTMHTTLNGLVARGLLHHVEEPPRVRYMLSSHGHGLMDAWWQVAEDWGIEHDAEMFEIVRASSNWFARPLER